jgi:GNAT superfamily N-acetyltransferase
MSWVQPLVGGKHAMIDPMTTRLQFTPFVTAQREACLALFDQNCPGDFAPNERADYEAFLDGRPDDYRVGEIDGRVVAAFGVMKTAVGRCRLSWIMVAKDAQGSGVGRSIMAEVLRHAAACGADAVDIAASHKSAPFFARFGALTRGRTENGWGPGMHRIDMELLLAGAAASGDALGDGRAAPLFQGDGGTVVLPDLVLVSRLDGGHLVVNPPRDVWERSELTRVELTAWSVLVAAAGRAMIDVLPQLAGGCVNYWEAGNWALHDDAEPRGAKDPRVHRRVHLHLLGRSRHATHESWQWGEAPRFPRFADRHTWARDFEPLSSDECGAIVERLSALLGS